jgi:hypothetical protein
MIIERAVALLVAFVASHTCTFCNFIQRILRFPRETFNCNRRFFAALRMTNYRISDEQKNKCSSIASCSIVSLLLVIPEERGIPNCSLETFGRQKAKPKYASVPAHPLLVFLVFYQQPFLHPQYHGCDNLLLILYPLHQVPLLILSSCQKKYRAAKQQKE